MEINQCDFNCPPCPFVQHHPQDKFSSFSPFWFTVVNKLSLLFLRPCLTHHLVYRHVTTYGKLSASDCSLSLLWRTKFVQLNSRQGRSSVFVVRSVSSHTHTVIAEESVWLCTRDLSLVSHQVHSTGDFHPLICPRVVHLSYPAAAHRTHINKRWQTAICETIVWEESVVWQVEAVNEALSFTFVCAPVVGQAIRHSHQIISFWLQPQAPVLCFTPTALPT